MSMQMDCVVNLVIFQVHNQLVHSFEVVRDYIESYVVDVSEQSNASHRSLNDVSIPTNEMPIVEEKRSIEKLSILHLRHIVGRSDNKPMFSSLFSELL